MVRRIAVLGGLGIVFVLLPSSFALAQTEGSSIFPKGFPGVEKWGDWKKGGAPIEFIPLVCPTDGREFQIGVTADDIEFMSGTKQVVCPYDGTTFFPSLAKPAIPIKEKLTLTTVRCPVDGREFKAEVNVEEVLSGRSAAALRCPYDGTKFRLGVFVPPKNGVQAESDLSTFKTAGDLQTFRALVEQGSTEDLFSPFDGSSLPVGTTLPPSLQALLDLQKKKGRELLETRPELSQIEEMFIKGVPQGVSRDIRQFGYNIFPEQDKESKQGETGIESPFQPSQGSWEIMRHFEGILGLGQQAGLGEMGSLEAQRTPTILSSIPIGPEYVVGPGDMLILNIWGSMQQSIPVTVDADGKIILPKAGPVYVWGLTFSETEDLIKKTLEQHYANFNISLSMGRLRKIRIFVFGEAKVPGAYYLSPQATVLHALYAAYGPTKLGTMRKIKLLRADTTEETVDLYEILIGGDNKRDLPLKANDTILVPPIGDVIGIAGKVKRPAIYETTGPVTLRELLDMAGGLSASGYLQRIQIERIKDHERKVVQDFEFVLLEDLQKKGSSITLQDGDLVSIFPIAAQRHNFVSILGNVERPGDYELGEGMRLRDLVEKAGGVLPGSYWERAELARYHTNREREILGVNLWKLMSGEETLNLPLKEWDVVTVYSKSEVIPPKFVEIRGAVHEPGTYELSEGMRVSDLLFRAGGLQESATLENAEIFRTQGEGASKVLSLDLNEILRESRSEKDFHLSEGDRIYVRESIADVAMGTISLLGEVRYPGEYPIRRGETLSSVIRRAGGFTEDAFLKGAVFTREALRQQQKERLRQFLETEQLSTLQEQASWVGVGSGSQKGDRAELLDYRRGLLEKLDQSQFLGRMIVTLDNPDTLTGTPMDIPLEDGDSLFVPRPPSSVLVVGNVYNPVAMTYLKGKKVDYYLRKVGGVTKGADKQHLYVIKANGEAISQFARVREIERGDTIIVPEAFKYKTPTGIFLRENISFLTQLIFGAIAVAAVN